MIKTVTKFETLDGKLFSSHDEAMRHWRIQVGIQKANAALESGMSLWHAAKLFPQDVYWSERWRGPSEVLKLLNKDFIIWSTSSKEHLQLRSWGAIDENSGITIYEKSIWNGAYSWDSGIYHTVTIGWLAEAMEAHVENHGWDSAPRLKRHWSQR